MHRAFACPRAAPSQCSAAVMATPSPAKTTGIRAPRAPSSAATRSWTGKPRQASMLTGLTVPREVSTGPALPMPQRTARSHSGSADRSATTSVTAAMTASGSVPRGVGRRVAAVIVPSGWTSAPAIFVPPMSTATVGPVASAAADAAAAARGRGRLRWGWSRGRS